MQIIETIIDYLLTSNRLPYPDNAFIDPVSNMCQLKCPLCPVGAQIIKHDRLLMPMDTFKIILDKMPFLRTLDLYRSGEPFLNPELLTMIHLANQRNIKVTVSTHFSFAKSDHFFDDLVASGLDKLVVSLDGASQKSYSRYRIGGNYDLVLANIKKLIEAKIRARSKNPIIIWQFLVNKYNEHEIATARKIAENLNISLELRPISLADNEPDVKHEPFSIEDRKKEWLPENDDYISDCYKGEYCYPLSDKPCAQLFTRVIVLADGKILPCCEAREKASAFGDLLTQSFEDIWFGRKYHDARLRALNIKNTPDEQSVCFRCNNFSTTPSIKEKLRLLATVYRSLFLLRQWKTVIDQ